MRRGSLVHHLANVLACVALVVAGCGTDRTSQIDHPLTTVRVAMSPGGATLPVHAAIERGIFEQNGLRVELTGGTDLPVFMAALAKRQYDIVMSVPTLIMIIAEKSLDVQVVSSVQRSSAQRPNAVWITKVRIGEIIGIVGRSGAGKTTVLCVLGGLLDSSSGTVVFDGEVVRRPPSGAVMVFQDYGNTLLPWRTVARNTGLGLEGRVGRDERRRRVSDALRMVGLSDRDSDYPWRLSGGWRNGCRSPARWHWNQRCC
jgi:ABC-type glutathione transport system ATPase component